MQLTPENNISQNAIGLPLNRIEAKAKVTGSAKYAAEYNLKDIAFGVLVTSTIAKGHILEIDSKGAEELPGVLAVISHLNAPPIPGYDKNPASAIPIFSGKEFKLFQGDEVYFNMQAVAMVVADSLEQANYAASLIKIKSSPEGHQTDIHTSVHTAVTPDKPSDYSRGEDNAWEKGQVKIEQEYETSIQVHNPMEPNAATAYW